MKRAAHRRLPSSEGGSRAANSNKRRCWSNQCCTVVRTNSAKPGSNPLQHPSSPSQSSLPTLPPEIWANVLSPYLPYLDILHVSTVSRMFLHDVMPLIEELGLFSPRELHVAPTRRFPNVKTVCTLCLVQCDDTHENETICRDTVGRIVPFLSRFPNLQEAFLGGLCHHDEDEEEGSNEHTTTDGQGGGGGAAAAAAAPANDGAPTLNKGPLVMTYRPYRCATNAHPTIASSLISSICGGYRSGLLNPRLEIWGLYCPRSFLPTGHGCDVCREACTSFPLREVLRFKSPGFLEECGIESAEKMQTCLPSWERMSIVANRPGGMGLLKSPSSLLHLLRSGICRQYKETSSTTSSGAGGSGVVCLVLCYTSAILEEISYIIVFGCDPSQLSHAEVRDSMALNVCNRGVVGDADYVAQPNADILTEEEAPSQLNISRASFRALVDFGIPLRPSDFRIVDMNPTDV